MPSQVAQHELVAVVAANIRAARLQAGLTQRQLAAKLDKDGSDVSRWERGVAHPRRGHLALLALALGRPVEWFYTGHPAPADDGAAHDVATPRQGSLPLGDAARAGTA